METKLPLLISVPHGGRQIPHEIRDRIALTEKEVFDDGDAFTRDLYNFRDDALAYIDTPIARAFIDLNRAPNERPPENPDGVVKTVTVNQCAVYKSGRFPSEPLIQTLLKNYYFPYHQVLDALQSNTTIKLALDCHSMLAMSPPISEVPGQSRPLFCLSNRGNKNGMPKEMDQEITSPPEMIQLLAKCFRKIFNCSKEEVKINEPFSGGYIIQSHYKGKIPWIQLEINRKLYLAPPYFDKDQLRVSTERILEIREKLLTVMKMFLNYLS